jgi:hypothetical protein
VCTANIFNSRFLSTTSPCGDSSLQEEKPFNTSLEYIINQYHENFPAFFFEGGVARFTRVGVVEFIIILFNHLHLPLVCNEG